VARPRAVACNSTDPAASPAHGKSIKWEIGRPWLRALAADEYGGVPSFLLTRWVNLFGEEIETVRRARNNIKFSDSIDDGNVAAGS
jgi:hypothetical protein